MHLQYETPTTPICIRFSGCTLSLGYRSLNVKLDSVFVVIDLTVRPTAWLVNLFAVPCGFLFSVDVARGGLRHGAADLSQGVRLQRGRGGVHPVVQVVVGEEDFARRVELRGLLLICMIKSSSSSSSSLHRGVVIILKLHSGVGGRGGGQVLPCNHGAAASMKMHKILDPSTARPYVKHRTESDDVNLYIPVSMYHHVSCSMT